MTVPVLEAPVPPPDVDRTARQEAEKLIDVPTLELRQGIIVSVDPTTATCSVRIGGSDTAVPTVKYLSNYKPEVDDTCVLLAYGTDIWALDRDGLFGSAAFSGYTADYVAAYESRSSASWGDLATFGPQIALVVPASGSILLGIGCGMQKFNGAPSGNAAMSTAGSGANVWAGGSIWPILQIGEGATTNGVAPAAGLGSVHVLTGMNPGLTTITAKYSGNTAQCDFNNRFMWAIPL